MKLTDDFLEIEYYYNRKSELMIKYDKKDYSYKSVIVDREQLQLPKMITDIINIENFARNNTDKKAKIIIHIDYFDPYKYYLIYIKNKIINNHTSVGSTKIHINTMIHEKITI